MATTLIESAAVISAVRDPTWVRIHCDGYWSSGPTAHHTSLARVDDGALAVGTSVTFTAPDGRSATIKAVSSAADDSGTQFQIGVDAAASWSNFLAACRSNHLLSSLYSVDELDTETAKFLSRSPGLGVLLIVPGDDWTSVTETVAGTVGDMQPNYRVGVAVYVEEEPGSNVYRPQPELLLTPDGSRVVQVNIAPFLRPFLLPTWPRPADNIVRCLNAQRRYYMARWEIYGTPAVDRAVQTSPVRHALLAGTRNAERDRWPAMIARIKNGVGGLTPWLTYRGRQGRHEVSRAQTHVLGWWCNVVREIGVNLLQYCTVYYTDGTTNTNSTGITSATGPDSLQYGELSFWQTSWSRLLLENRSAGRQPYKYDVWISKSTGEQLTEKHTFWLVAEDPNEQYIEYLNSFGVVESVRCEGRSVQTLNPTYTELERQLLPDITAIVPVNQVANSQRISGAQGTLQVHTGYLDAQEHRALADLLMSPEVRLVDQHRNQTLPVRLAAGSHELRVLGEAGEHLYAYDLKLSVLDPEMAWSDLTSIT